MRKAKMTSTILIFNSTENLSLCFMISSMNKGSRLLELLTHVDFIHALAGAIPMPWPKVSGVRASLFSFFLCLIILRQELGKGANPLAGLLKMRR